MNELSLVFAWCGGSLLGAMFFGGLWWTSRRGVSAKEPALWFVGSFTLRTGMALIGFYAVAHGHWERLVACLVGFVMAQAAVIWLTRTNDARRHAP